jgi:hypothetical protein
MAPRVPNDPTKTEDAIPAGATPVQRVEPQAPAAPRKPVLGEIISTPQGFQRVVNAEGTMTTTAIHETHLYPAALIEAEKSGRTVIECETDLRKRLGFDPIPEDRVAARLAEETSGPEAQVVPYTGE